MKSLKHFLVERTSGDILNTKKNNWVEFDPSKLSDTEKTELSKEFIDLISTAYAPIGGHIKFATAADVFKDPKIKVWKAIDLHGDSDVDLVLFGKDGKYGVKYTGVGHDGQKASTREYLSRKAKDLSKPGFYNEVSGKLADILIGKYKIPAVLGKETLEKILGKSIEYHGNHPDGETPGDGWYTRKIAGSSHVKILLGKPKGL